MSDYERAKAIILKRDKPFFLSDLVNVMIDAGIKDRNVIYNALDDLCEEGIVTYERANGLIDESDGLSPVYKYSVYVA